MTKELTNEEVAAIAAIWQVRETPEAPEAPEAPREVGSINYWNEVKGFGFIKRLDSTSAFVHRDDIEGEPRTLLIGTPVEFQLTRQTPPRGLKATLVKVIK